MTTSNSLSGKGFKGSNKNQKPARPASAPRAKSSRRADTTALRSWLDSQGFTVNPTIKVNGPSFSTAVVTVDFGSPLSSPRLSGEQTEKLSTLLKSVTGDFYNGPVNIRVSYDAPNGVYWTSVSA